MNTLDSTSNQAKSQASKPLPLAVFVGSYLPYSETFIFDQLSHQKQFDTQVYAYKKVPSAERFPFDKVVALGDLECEYYKWVGKSPTFSKELALQDPAVIHAHFGTNGTYATPFAKKLKKPLVTTFHGHDVPGLFPENRFTTRYFRYQMFAQKMLEYNSLALPASQELADILMKQFNIPSSKLEIHRLGIDLSRFTYAKRPDREVKILMVGRFVEKKGFIYALEAFKSVEKKHPNAKLTIVGSGPLEQEYLRYIQENNLQEKVNFPGTMTSAELQNLMLDHDLLMAPSVVSQNGDRESGLIVLKEAAATGLPTIGTWHGGLPEIIDHQETGFLVQERDSQAIANHLDELLSSHTLRLELGQNARRKMEREYDTVTQNALLEEHFLSVI